MLMTSEAARAKWCPFGRVIGNTSASMNDPDSLHFARCIGDDCAAWRWKHAPGAIYQHEDGRNTSTPHGAGYCGLAGEPRP